MNELVLTLRSPLPRRLDGSSLVPDRLAELAVREIERLPLRFEDGEPVPIGEFFEVKGSASSDVRLSGDLSWVDGLGTGMSLGSLRIEGSVGHRLGEAMSAGRIEIDGDASNFVGREMRGGEIVVRGNVGDGTGSGSPGSKRGMTGGEIVVFGDAGAETGACMRRGVIAVAGTVGPRSLRSAIAGTLIAFGDVAAPAGRWSKRATLIAMADVAIPPSYEHCCTYRPGFVQVLLTHLRRNYGMTRSSQRDLFGFFELYQGDMAELGRGEILRCWKVGTP